jgi:hypothetical protein
MRDTSSIGVKFPRTASMIAGSAAASNVCLASEGPGSDPEHRSDAIVLGISAHVFERYRCRAKCQQRQQAQKRDRYSQRARQGGLVRDVAVQTGG